MIRIRRGTVLAIEENGATQELLVQVEGKEEKALNYARLTGPVLVGSEVVLNTTAVALGLGTGGLHFVIHVLGNDRLDPNSSGHIMKLRYTPLQIKTLSVEEQDSSYHQTMAAASTLQGCPVIVGSLHSMLGSAAAAFKRSAGINRRLVYVMTDGAALPLDFSRLVKQLKSMGLIDATITIGHAFGGDYEAVNVYSGMLAAKEVGGADAIIVCMGPGVVGTGTRYGATALEVAPIADAVNSLNGTPIIIPRISFADKRERHLGISHHTLTALGQLTYSSVKVAMPKLWEPESTRVLVQLADSGIDKKHEVVVQEASFIGDYMQELGLNLTTMGRGYEDDPAFFQAAAAAGIIAAKCPSPVDNATV